MSGIWLIPGLMQCIQELTWARAKGTASLPVTDAVLHFVPAWLPWAALTPVVLWLTRRFPISRESWRRSLLVHALGAVACGLLHTLALGWVRVHFPPTGWPSFGLAAWLRNTLWSLHTQAEFLAYGGVVLLGHAQQAWQAARERELRALRLEAQLAQSRLGALQSQLQPHFLFNTLNAIDVLVEEDPASAKRMLLRLSELLRRTLDGVGLEQALGLELEHLECYLEIERVRFSDRLKVHVDAEPATLGLWVPRLLLQPLVENALRHGLAPRAAGGQLWITARLHAATLCLTVEDDGVGLDSGLNQGRDEGIGLSNTRGRLRGLYGSVARLELLARAGGGTVVRLQLPRRVGPESGLGEEKEAPEAPGSGATAGGFA